MVDCANPGLAPAITPTASKSPNRAALLARALIRRRLPVRQSGVIETRVATSPAVDSERTKPIPLAYHLFSLPGSSSDHSSVRTQSLKVPAGTVTDSPSALIWAMSSATPRLYSWRKGSSGVGIAGMRMPGSAPSTPASHEPCVLTAPPGLVSSVASPNDQTVPCSSCATRSEEHTSELQ